MLEFRAAVLLACCLCRGGRRQAALEVLQGVSMAWVRSGGCSRQGKQDGRTGQKHTSATQEVGQGSEAGWQSWSADDRALLAVAHGLKTQLLSEKDGVPTEHVTL